MSLVSISDVHIKHESDERTKLLMLFLTHPKTQNAHHIVLLGDIFDLMVGSHKEYIEKFEFIFQKLANHCQQGKRIYYLEGNHDFHLQELFVLVKDKFGIGEEFQVLERDTVLEMCGEKVYLTHGDNIEIGNPGYQVYKNIVKNNLMKFVANKVMPYSFLHKVGEYASEKSRQRNKEKYTPSDSDQDEGSTLEEVQINFRRSAEIVSHRNEGLSAILAGHSHVQDHYKLETGCAYVNNGFAPKTKSFIYKESGKEAIFESLE